MDTRRILGLILGAALTLVACGGSSDDPGEGAAADGPATSTPDDADTDGGASDPSETDDSGADPGSDDAPAGDAAPLTAAWSVPVNGTALGASVAVSPDGSRVALVTGGLEPSIEIRDGATGDVVDRAAWHGQGTGLVWTSADQLVSYDDDQLHVVDVATLTYGGAADLTVGPGAEDCPAGAFTVRLDRGADAIFVAEFHDSGTIVCRLDVGAAEMTATVIDGAGGGGQLFLRPETGELIVPYSAESVARTDSVAVLDAETLAVVSAGPSPSGAPVHAATAADLVIAADRFTDTFAGSGTALAGQARGERFGNVLVGSNDLAQIVLMDATTGEARYVGSEAFKPLAGTDDGTTLVVLARDALEYYRIA